MFSANTFSSPPPVLFIYLLFLWEQTIHRDDWCVLQQDDIRNYIDDSLKRGVHLSLFRKERIGGDSHGVSYW